MCHVIVVIARMIDVITANLTLLLLLLLLQSMMMMLNKILITL